MCIHVTDDLHTATDTKGVKISDMYTSWSELGPEILHL